MTIAERINELTEAGDYRGALDLGVAASPTGRPDVEVLRALLRMTSRLRSVCIDLAYRKQDIGLAYEALEAILIEAGELTDEDIYGRRRS